MNLKFSFFIRCKAMVFTLIMIMLLSPSGLYAQQKLNIDAKSVSLIEVLNTVKVQTGYKFVYTDALDVNAIKVTVNVRDEKPLDFFKSFFPKYGIKYKIDGKLVTLSPAVKPSSSGSVKGTVEDAQGNSVVGVIVTVKGKEQYAVSDEDGKYSMENLQNGDLLTFTILGFKEVTAAFSEGADLNIVMEEDVDMLEDVVVTGYQTISKERATGSFNTVTAEQLDKPATSVRQSLVGNVSGLQVINKGYRDKEESIIIRGLTSLGANSEPLIIVDGFAIEGKLSSINPNDIANITVLKDAAAASIWGARSANGVIVVTTKSAQKGKVNVELNAFVKFRGKMDLNYANPMASSAEMIEYEKFGFSTNFFNKGMPLPDNWSSLIYNGYFPKYYSGAVVAMNEDRLGFLGENLNTVLNRLAAQDNKQQIRNNLLSMPVTQQYNLAISGGNENINDALSLMFDDNIGHFAGNKDRRWTINNRTNVKLYKWLSLNVNTMFQYAESKDRGVSLAVIQNIAPYEMLLGGNGEYLHVQKDMYLPIIDRYITQKGVKFPYADWTYNPVREMNGTDNSVKSLYGRIQAGLNVRIIEGLTVDSKIQYEIMDMQSRNLFSEDTYHVRQAVNMYSQWDGNAATPVVQNVAKGMSLTESGSRMNAWNVRNQITFSRNFADKHDVSAIIGTEVYKKTFVATFRPEVFGYNDDQLSTATPPHGINYAHNLYNMFGETPWAFAGFDYPAPRRSYNVDKYFSLYANASYTYDSRYTVSVSYRTDASNLISSDPSIRYSPFWSVGALWQIGKEKLMRNYNWLDRLVFRATYGFNGNVDKSTSVDPLISIWGQNPYTGTGRGIISNYGNPRLGWEKTGSLNIGLDFAMFDNKLMGSIEYYNKKGRDLISETAIANVYGSDTQSINAIEMYNRGVELVLGSYFKAGRFSWNGNLNIACNKNRITKLLKDKATLAYRVYGPNSGWEFTEGYDANTLWSFKYGGIQEVGGQSQPVIVDKDGKNPRAMTAYNTGFDSYDYLIASGTTTPPWVIGFTNIFKLADFSLSFIITGYFGHKFRMTTFNYPEMVTGAGLINKFYKDVKNCNPDKFIPIPEDGKYPRQMSGYVNLLDNTIANAANIRFQEINLTYTLPGKAVRKIGMKGLKIYGQLNDAGVITFNKNHEDPFFPMGTYKPGTACTFGIKINF